VELEPKPWPAFLECSRAEKLLRFSDRPQWARDEAYLAQLERVATGRIRMPEHKAKEWALGKFVAKFGRTPERRAA
jgi:hypothetical protein